MSILMKLYNENSTVEWQFFSLNFYSDTQKHFVIGLLNDNMNEERTYLSKAFGLNLYCANSSTFFFEFLLSDEDPCGQQKCFKYLRFAFYINRIRGSK